jgi:hypothetical protein
MDGKNSIRKFQREMEKMNMGVTIQLNDETPVVVTSKCPYCERYFGDVPSHVKAKHPRVQASYYQER